jgi:class 3 adenylate cyclase
MGARDTENGMARPSHSAWGVNGSLDSAWRDHGPAVRLRPTEVLVTSRPIYRTVLAVDIERSTQRPDPVKAELRRETYRVVQEAMDVAGIRLRHCDPFVDRGDGVLILVRPVDEIPKTLLFQVLVPVLTHLLVDRNTSLPETERVLRELRLRMVIHSGEVHCDGNGPFGETLDVACRLLDSRSLKKCLANSGAPLVLVISDEIYHSIVLHDYDGIRPAAFIPSLTVRVSGRRRRGWVHVPAVAAADARPGYLAPAV